MLFCWIHHSRITSVFLFITSVDTVKESEDGEAGVQEASSTPDTPVSAETGKKKKPWWRRWLLPRRKVCSTELSDAVTSNNCHSNVDSACYVNISKSFILLYLTCFFNLQQKQKSASPVETGGAERSPPPEAAEADSSAISGFLPTDAPRSRQSTPTGHGGSLQAESGNADVWEEIYGRLFTSARTETLSREELVCLG